MGVHTLYGAPLSLYTGKARSYLIKNGVPYREVAPITTHYEESVLPRAKQRMVPTLETSDGIVIRDGAAIIEHFEAEAGHPATPKSPRQRILSRLFDVIAMEGLLRPAMHYRWNFPEENEAFLKHHFASMTPANRDSEAFAERAMGSMRQAAVAFGVTPGAIEGIEARYLELIGLFDRHFALWPYLFGGRPSIGDFSLIAPMYGHLGRDPKPLSLMQSKAFHLFRWVERMNRPEADSGEFVADGVVLPDDSFASNDEVPDTLIAVLRQIAIEFVPETIAIAAFINRWLDEQADLSAGTPLQRGLGLANFEIEGEAIHSLAQPYRFHLLNRVHADFDAMTKVEQGEVEQLLAQCNLLPILEARLNRQIGRQDNCEVWLAPGR